MPALKFDTTKFVARLEKIPIKARDAVNAAIEKDAKDFVDMAQRIAPKDPKDGIYLAPSIRSEKTETGGQIVRAGGPTTTKATEHGPVDYAVLQEFGTHRFPASPFFWPTFRTLKKRFQLRRRRALNKALKEG